MNKLAELVREDRDLTEQIMKLRNRQYVAREQILHEYLLTDVELLRKVSKVDWEKLSRIVGF